MFAKIISAVFSPYFTAILLWIVIGTAYGINRETLSIGLVLVIFCNVLPALFVGIMIKLRRIADMHISFRKERFPFYAFLCFSCLFGGIVLFSMGYILGIRIWGSLFITSLAISGVNVVWKVSSHCAAISVVGYWAAVIFGTPLIIILSIAAVSIVGWARVYLGHHSLAQVVVGALVGILACKCAFLGF